MKTIDKVLDEVSALTPDQVEGQFAKAVNDPKITAATMLALMKVMREHDIEEVVVSAAEPPSPTNDGIAIGIDEGARTIHFVRIKEGPRPTVTN